MGTLSVRRAFADAWRSLKSSPLRLLVIGVLTFGVASQLGEDWSFGGAVSFSEWVGGFAGYLLEAAGFVLIARLAFARSEKRAVIVKKLLIVLAIESVHYFFESIAIAFGNPGSLTGLTTILLVCLYFGGAIILEPVFYVLSPMIVDRGWNRNPLVAAIDLIMGNLPKLILLALIFYFPFSLLGLISQRAFKSVIVLSLGSTDLSLDSVVQFGTALVSGIFGSLLQVAVYQRLAKRSAH